MSVAYGVFIHLLCGIKLFPCRGVDRFDHRASQAPEGAGRGTPHVCLPDLCGASGWGVSAARAALTPPRVGCPRLPPGVLCGLCSVWGSENSGRRGCWSAASGGQVSRHLAAHGLGFRVALLDRSIKAPTAGSDAKAPWGPGPQSETAKGPTGPG